MNYFRPCGNLPYWVLWYHSPPPAQARATLRRMTIEIRTTIEMKDVLSLEFECSKCHAKISFPVGTFDAAPIRCTACGDKGEQWIIPGSGEWEDLKRLGQIVRWYSAEKPSPFRLRLELKPAGSQK